MARKKLPEEGSEKAESEAVSVSEDITDVSPTSESTVMEDAPLIIEAEAVETSDKGSDRAETENSPRPLPPKAETQRGFAPLFLGGIVAGGIGFVAALYGLPLVLPDGQASQDLVTQEIAANSRRIDDLAGELARVDSRPLPEVDLTPLASQIEGLENKIAAVNASLDEVRTNLTSGLAVLGTRLTTLEERPEEPAGVANAAAAELELESFRRELQQLTADAESQVSAARARAAEVETAAAEAAAATERQATLARILMALDSGAPYGEALAGLNNVPKALTAGAEGVATLAELQRDFPEAARMALAGSVRVPQTASVTEKVSAFFLQRTNARSLTPREGEDPDAILSRAEAQLSEGDLAGTLDELAALPETARDEMSGWLDLAQARVDAIAALTSLTAPN